jgi:hypothetical protein
MVKPPRRQGQQSKDAPRSLASSITGWLWQKRPDGQIQRFWCRATKQELTLLSDDTVSSPHSSQTPACPTRFPPLRGIFARRSSSEISHMIPKHFPISQDNATVELAITLSRTTFVPTVALTGTLPDGLHHRHAFALRFSASSSSTLASKSASDAGDEDEIQDDSPRGITELRGSSLDLAPSSTCSSTTSDAATSKEIVLAAAESADTKLWACFLEENAAHTSIDAHAASTSLGSTRSQDEQMQSQQREKPVSQQPARIQAGPRSQQPRTANVYSARDNKTNHRRQLPCLTCPPPALLAWLSGCSESLEGVDHGKELASRLADARGRLEASLTDLAFFPTLQAHAVQPVFAELQACLLGIARAYADHEPSHAPHDSQQAIEGFLKVETENRRRQLAETSKNENTTNVTSNINGGGGAPHTADGNGIAASCLAWLEIAASFAAGTGTTATELTVAPAFASSAGGGAIAWASMAGHAVLVLRDIETELHRCLRFAAKQRSAAEKHRNIGATNVTGAFSTMTTMNKTIGVAYRASRKSVMPYGTWWAGKVAL